MEARDRQTDRPTDGRTDGHDRCMMGPPSRKDGPIKSSNVYVKSMFYSQIWQNFAGDEYLCKLRQEYLNASLPKFVIYSLQHSETFDVSQVFLPLTIAELSTLKQVRFFGPLCMKRGQTKGKGLGFGKRLAVPSLQFFKLFYIQSIGRAGSSKGAAMPRDEAFYIYNFTYIAAYSALPGKVLLCY